MSLWLFLLYGREIALKSKDFGQLKLSRFLSSTYLVVNAKMKIHFHLKKENQNLNYCLILSMAWKNLHNLTQGCISSLLFCCFPPCTYLAGPLLSSLPLFEHAILFHTLMFALLILKCSSAHLWLINFSYSIPSSSFTFCVTLAHLFRKFIIFVCFYHTWNILSI